VKDVRAEFDLIRTFFHDVPPEITAEAMAAGEPTAGGQAVRRAVAADRMASGADSASWAGRDDRLFPLAFQQRVVKERLGIEVDAIPGGHLSALSQPVALAEQLVSYLTNTAR